MTIFHTKVQNVVNHKLDFLSYLATLRILDQKANTRHIDVAQQPVAQVDLSVTNETRGAPPTVVALTPIAHALQHTFTRTRHKMAAFTFNPLVLSARAVAPAKATRSTRRAAKSALRCSATSEEEDVMGEIGLGDLEDIMAKADGGASVPKFIADLGI